MEPIAVRSQLAGSEREFLRNRLTIEDPVLASEPVADLMVALKRFQEQHGLPADGRLGPRTLAELNITADARIEQIMAKWSVGAGFLTELSPITSP